MKWFKKYLMDGYGDPADWLRTLFLILLGLGMLVIVWRLALMPVTQ